MPRQTWIADRCRQYGLTVVEVDGWRTRGDDVLAPGGVVCHHTAGASTGEIPSLRTLIHGRSDLPGPLCHVGLARSGTCYIVAAGRANHAGSGGWKGLRGNSSVLGIEAENDGRQGWPSIQIEAFVRLAAALQSGTAHPTDAEYVCAHREWTTRKPDPHSIDMTAFRARVRGLLQGEDDMFTDDDRDLLATAATQVGQIHKVIRIWRGELADDNPMVMDLFDVVKRIAQGGGGTAPAGMTGDQMADALEAAARSLRADG